MARASLEEIKKQAKECLETLSKCKTIGDLRNLRHIGINESDIAIMLFEETDLDYLDLASLPQDSSFYEVRLDIYPDSILAYPTYFTESGEFYFDVFDEEVDDMYPYLEDKTLETIEEDYNKYEFEPEYEQ